MAATIAPPPPRVVGAPLRLLGDDALARLVAQGRDGAFAVLYDRYHARLQAYCRTILWNDEDARDACHTAMLNALPALRNGALREGRVRPWLFRVARNAALDAARARRTHEPLDDELLPAGEAVEDSVDRRERLAALLADVRELPERQREALLLRELAGLSYAEIAEVVGAGSGAVRQAVSEARQALHADARARDASCDSVRATLAGADGRRRRTRLVRAHLRGCQACRGWEATESERRRSLALLPGLWLASASVSGIGAASAGGGGALMTWKAVGALAAGVATVQVAEPQRAVVERARPAVVAEARAEVRESPVRAARPPSPARARPPAAAVRSPKRAQARVRPVPKPPVAPPEPAGERRREAPPAQAAPPPPMAEGGPEAGHAPSRDPSPSPGHGHGRPKPAREVNVHSSPKKRGQMDGRRKRVASEGCAAECQPPPPPPSPPPSPPPPQQQRAPEPAHSPPGHLRRAERPRPSRTR